MAFDIIIFAYDVHVHVIGHCELFRLVNFCHLFKLYRLYICSITLCMPLSPGYKGYAQTAAVLMTPF